MKKLLSLLSVLTISGMAMPTVIAAAPWSKNVNLLENWYKFLAHNELIAYISHSTWQKIAFNHDVLPETEFSNSLFSILNSFEKRDHSGGTGAYDYIQSSDIEIIRDVIIDHYTEINEVFLSKNDNSIGIGIKTNRAKYWYNNPNNLNWGVHPNSEKIFP